MPPIHDFKAHLHVRYDAQYKLFKPTPVPYAFTSKIEDVLDKLEVLSIISEVSTAEFSTSPIVPVLKPNWQVRICKNFKVTVNWYLDLTQYPLLHIEKIFKRFSEKEVYSKLDVPEAFLQVKLDEESRRHVVITTHKVLFSYNRLCYGIASAYAMFQKII